MNNKNEIATSRKTNLEMLRIFSMLLIITHHYSVHGGFDLVDNSSYINKFIIQFLSLGGRLGVNCFVLISGYFLIDSSFKIKKLFKLWFEIFFYSVIITVIFYSFGISNLGIKYLLSTFMPVFSGAYWFATAYVIFYILTPYINLFIHKLTQTMHIRLIVILLFIWTIVPTFTNKNIEFTDITWFITLYLIVAYIKIYPNEFFERCINNFVIAFIAFGFVIVSVGVFDLLIVYGGLIIDPTYFMAINKIPIVICSITLFLGFKNLKMEDNKLVNSIAECMFGVYLIHDNNLIKPFLWLKIARNNTYASSRFLLLHAALTIFIVFIVCTIIDRLRIKLVEKPLLKLVEKKWFLIDRSLTKLNSKINKIFNVG